MFCSNCGTKCHDDTKFCPSCGSKIADEQQPANVQQNFNQQNENQTNYQQNYTQPDYNQQNFNQQNYNQPNYNQPNNYVQPQNYNAPQMYNVQPAMNWYKFLIYFALFAGAVVNCIFAILQMTGMVYGTESGYSVAEYVYLAFPALRFLDIFYGILLIALAAFQVFTRFQLAGFKKNAPNLVLMIYAAGIAISLLYLAISSIICGTSTFDASSIGSIIGSAVMIIVNKVYFDKRKDMFVN